MSDAGLVQEFPERNGIKSLTVASGWIKRWKHFGGLGYLKTFVTHANLFMSYTRAEEEEIHVGKLGELLDVLEESSREEMAHRDFCCFYCPYEEFWFIHRHYYWCPDLYFERRQR